MQFNQTNKNAGDVSNSLKVGKGSGVEIRVANVDAGKKSEQIARFLFTGSDGTEYERLTQQDDDGSEGMRMDWRYVVENIKRILET